ncbi:ACE-like protein, partial [Mya arenaria]
YFVSNVLQIQLHASLCEAIGDTGPLHRCDIYNSTLAGLKLQHLLQQGSSRPWADILEETTGLRKLSTEPLKRYFHPLTDWLKKQNEGKAVGWTDACPEVPVQYEAEVGYRGYPSAADFLKYYNQAGGAITNKDVVAQWAYESNITDNNRQAMVNSSVEYSQFRKEMTKEANRFRWHELDDVIARRQFRKITDIGTSALEDEQLKEKKMSIEQQNFVTSFPIITTQENTKSMEDDFVINNLADVKARMAGTYGMANLTMSDGRTLALDPGLTQILTSSRNYSELLEAWKGWRDVTGPNMRANYVKFVELSNKAIRQLGYADTGAYWRQRYEAPTFQEDLRKLLADLKPLYRLLHTYVRRRLMIVYGAQHFPTSGHIPAHLLGNMWAQKWDNIYDIVEPFPGVEEIDVTPEMLRQNYTVTRMFRVAEEFFTSLGLETMPPSFWERTLMQQPDHVTMVCHASAWDFYDQHDFRIKMCTEVNMENLLVIHHEMGHVQYFLQYRNQPVVFREGANPGFHEAIGDVMALSVSTPRHLATIGLLDKASNTHEGDINFLLRMALEKVSFLPFGYLIDQWRWSVFSGETTPQQYNQKWWDLRCEYQGVSPPVGRGDDDFDPGAKYHIPANVPYIRYFVSYVVQFQFHEALCDAANHSGPLHTCDIYNSQAAGDALMSVLKLGSSRPWPDAMQMITGRRTMDAGAILEYFRPLITWLEQETRNERPGWSAACPQPEDTTPPEVSTPLELTTPSKCSFIENRNGAARHISFFSLIVVLFGHLCSSLL